MPRRYGGKRRSTYGRRRRSSFRIRRSGRKRYGRKRGMRAPRPGKIGYRL